MQKLYIQNKGKVINTGKKFAHIMAITLNPKKDYKEGILRCIVKREGDVQIRGYTDFSELYKVSGSPLKTFYITEKLKIKNEDKIIKKLVPKGYEFIGLEDPDIFIDEKTNLMHVYFTIPIKPIDKNKGKIKIHLGHAVGKDLDSLKMTAPVLLDCFKFCAKEVSIAPINKKGFRYNLIESRDRQKDMTYSIIQIAKAKDMSKNWEYGKIAFHPKEHNIPWIAGHASPGPLFSKNFINIGEGKLLGLINGREANKKRKDGSIKYGMFSIGLFIYDHENGKIEWVSPKPFIRDTEAVTITFASQFIEIRKGEGILYAHVDDSFIRSYKLKASKIKSILPKEYL